MTWASEDNPYSDNACATGNAVFPAFSWSPTQVPRGQLGKTPPWDERKPLKTSLTRWRERCPASVPGSSLRENPSTEKEDGTTRMRSDNAAALPACTGHPAFHALPARDWQKHRARNAHTRSGACEALSLPPAAPWIIKTISNATGAAGSDVPGLPKRSLASLVLMR